MSATSKRDRALRDGVEPVTGKDHYEVDAPKVAAPEAPPVVAEEVPDETITSL